MRQCNKCKNIRKLNEFYRDIKGLNGRRSICKLCNKKDKYNYFIKFPWLKHLKYAKNRCLNPNNQDYSRYGGRGIKLLLDKYDIEFLWIRDKAYLMKCPSLDRIDNNDNYKISNCQMIERNENARRRWIEWRSSSSLNKQEVTDES